MADLPFTGERFVADLDAPEIAYEHWHRYLYASRFAAGKSVLDVASGEGYGSALLARTAREVVGVDVAEPAVAAATERYASGNLRFQRGTVDRLPFQDGAFDLVVSFETVEHVDGPAQRTFVAEVRRVLAFGGLFLVSTPDRRTYSDVPGYRNPFHVQELYPDEFRTLLQAAFPHVALISQRNCTGSYLWHPGRAEGPAAEYLLERSPEGFRPARRAMEQIYVVAACSGRPLPELPASVMVDLDERRLRAREEQAAGLLRLLRVREAELQAERERAARLEKVILDLDAAVREIPGWSGTTPAKVAFGPARPAVGPAAPRPVSIVIPVWNKAEYTRRCLESIIRFTPEELFEVVIVDNGSTDGTAELLAALDGDVRVIRNRENAGFVGACNQGAAAARGKYLLFLNNDTEPQEGWLQALVAAAEADPAAGAVGAKLVYPDGRLQEAGGLVFSDASGWNFGRGADPGLPALNRPCEVDYCSGAALLVRRDLFERLGGFDARYAPAYYEDTDLCFGIRKLGHKVLYCPGAVVIHHEGITAGTDLAAGMKRHQAENRARFAAKWADELRAQDPPPGAGDGPPSTADRARLARLARAPAVPAGDGPRVLVVDPLMPLHDRASGSLRLFRLLRLMRDAGCQVTYVARDGSGQERYRQELLAMGIDAHAGDPERMASLGRPLDAPRIDLPRFLARGRFDLAWLSTWHIAAQYLPLLRAHSPATKLVVDTVDVHFLREWRQAEVEGRTLPSANELRAAEQCELAVYRAADTVVTVTDGDAQALRERGLRVPIAVIPNVHPAARSRSTPVERRSGLLFVGNFAHPPNVDAIRWFCAEVWPLVQARIPGVRLSVVGGCAPEEVRALASPSVTITGPVPEMEPYLEAARVSIAPLRFGAGMKGKIGEALAHGLPVVTTPLGAEGMGLVDREQVLIAPDAAAFAAGVVELHADPELWSSLAAAGAAHAESLWGPAAVARRLAPVLRARRRAGHGARRQARGG